MNTIPLKEELYKLYWEGGLSQREIGEKIGKSQSWVSMQMRKWDMPTKNIDIKTRFLYYVKMPENLNACWEWVGSKDYNGYGIFGFNKKLISAHRISYMLYKGEFDQILCCLHTCDNPGCVNPNHLYLGTQEDNIKDREQKDRTAKGEKLSQSKLTEEAVIDIKVLLLRSIPHNKIGLLFGVAPNTISNIKTGRTWKHLG